MVMWPWPLDGVQGWFEAFWNWVGAAAVNAVSVVSSWIWGAIYWLRDRVNEGLGYASNYMYTLISWLSSQVSNSLNWLNSQTWGFITWLRDRVVEVVNGISNWISSARDTLGKCIEIWSGYVISDLSGRINWLRDRLSEGWNYILNGVNSARDIIGRCVETWGGYVIGSVRTMFDGALGTIGDWVRNVLAGVVEALGSGLQSFWEWLLKHLTWMNQMVVGAISSVAAAIKGTIASMFEQVVAGFAKELMPGSPSPEIEAASRTLAANLYERIMDEVKKVQKSPAKPEEAIAAGVGLLGLMTTVSTVAHTLGAVFDATHPIKKWGTDELITHIEYNLLSSAFGSPIIQVPVVAGILTPMRYAYNKMFLPMIPGAGDLIRMVVREAFVAEMIIPAPPEFVDAMSYQGFDKTWCDRYWTAHFEPIALSQAYANLWRGYWNKEQFMYALHIADIHPMWREDIYSVAFRAPSARELGYGFDTGLYSVEDITKYRRWEGLAPEDAEKAARAMVAYRTESEREALRREALADFEAWLDDESQLRVNLKAIGGRDEVIDLWVARAEYRRARDFILDMVKVSVDLHYKGHINDQGLDQDLIGLGIMPEGRQKIITEAKSRRLKAVVEEKAAKKKVMPEARVRQARDLGLISDPEYVQRLLDHDWIEEDARLDLAIELTPKLVTPEERERRRKTITSKRARAVRRYELLITRVQDQIDLTAGQLEDTRVTMEESLDVIDAQIAAVEEDLAVAPPEKVPDLEQRRTVLIQRRELQVTRWESRIRTLTEQHKNLLDTRELVTRQRDEELAEYDNELALLEVAG